MVRRCLTASGAALRGADAFVEAEIVNERLQGRRDSDGWAASFEIDCTLLVTCAIMIASVVDGNMLTT